MGKIKSVLFVCTGNSCRSVMAEALLKKRLKELGRTGITVRSAGMNALNGLPPTDETIEALKEEGIELGEFRSSSITADLIKGSDLILTMTSSHKEEILKCAPEAVKKTFLLKEYGRPESSGEIPEPDIPDPIGMPMSGYRKYRKTIKEEIERVAKLL